MQPAKPKTIRKVISKKVQDWLSSLPKELAEQVSPDVIVTGGCITSMLMGVPINDFDLYLKTQSSALALAKHYASLMPDTCIEVMIRDVENIKGQIESRVVNFIPSAGVTGKNPDEPDEADQWLDKDESASEPEPKKKYYPQFISQNAITLSGSIQVITRFHGEVDEIHKNFDFVHATCCYDNGTGELTLPPKALESMLTKDLKYTGSLYPIASIFRAKKFIERGWRVTAGELLKISFQVSEIDMTKIETLNDQLTGVDAAYMRALINALENVDPEKLNSTYVAEIIDRIFNS